MPHSTLEANAESKAPAGAPAWLTKLLVIARDGVSHFVCPACGPNGDSELLDVAQHWSHLDAVDRLLFRGQLAVVGEGSDVDDVVEWLDHQGLSDVERSVAHEIIVGQELAADADPWDIATEAETERRRLARLYERASSEDTPHDELVSLSAHPASFVQAAALATLTNLRRAQREALGSADVDDAVPGWLKHDMLRGQGLGIRMHCPVCRSSVPAAQRYLRVHVRHMSRIDRVLLIGQLEAAINRESGGVTAGDLSSARDWLLRNSGPMDGLEQVVREVVTYLPRENVVGPFSVRDLRRWAVKAESVRLALARDLRAARKGPSAAGAGGSYDKYLKHPVGFVRAAAIHRFEQHQRELRSAEQVTHDAEVEVARPSAPAPPAPAATKTLFIAPAWTGTAWEVPTAASNLEVQPVAEPEPIANAQIQVEPEDEPTEAAAIVRDLVADLGAAIGAVVEGRASRPGLSEVWTLRDDRPFVGGTYVAMDCSSLGPGAAEVRTLIEAVEETGAVRGIMVCPEPTAELEALVWRRPIILIAASELAGQAPNRDGEAGSGQDAGVSRSVALEALGVGAPEAAAVSSVRPEPVQPRDPEPGEAEGSDSAPVPPDSAADRPLAERLLDSARFQEQRASVGRHAPDADFVRRIIRAAEDYQGTIPWMSFVSTLGTSEAGARMRLPVLRRLLNVDGYEVVEVAEGEGVVRVDLPLLRVQFGLG